MHKDGKEVRRAYSIASMPGQKELTIGVKKVEGGSFSVYANEVLKAGDSLEVMAPEGRFVFEPRERAQDLVAFVAGSGITPLMSIIRTALKEHPDTRIVLVYGNQSKEETMFYAALQELKAKYTDRLTIHYLFSRSQEEEGSFGRIDRSIVNFITRNKHKDLNPDRFYLCGPLAMIETVAETLKENGVAEDRISHELFTEPQGEDPLTAGLEGITHLEVTLDDVVHQLDMDQKSLILNAVLKAKIDAPYSCQGGVCSTCIARVTEGSAEMVKNQILTESEIAEGLILTCQAHPTSPMLKIDYDDV
jgi:ring-1,2-phenylacetyl-CoA epoxidase subunit PaaE